MSDIDDSAERRAIRDQTVKAMTADELYGYRIGLSHAYGDVFQAFTDAFNARPSGDIHTVLNQLRAQWDDVQATRVVKGAAL